jgi:hypothetical protein
MTRVLCSILIILKGESLFGIAGLALFFKGARTMGHGGLTKSHCCGNGFLRPHCIKGGFSQSMDEAKYTSLPPTYELWGQGARAVRQGKRF